MSELGVELVETAQGVRVLQVVGGVAPMPVARATVEGTRWRVRALLCGHEELVDSEAAACQCLWADVHEAFPGHTWEASA